jgi:hypothetical protein
MNTGFILNAAVAALNFGLFFALGGVLNLICGIISAIVAAACFEL